MWEKVGMVAHGEVQVSSEVFLGRNERRQRQRQRPTSTGGKQDSDGATASTTVAKVEESFSGRS